MSRNLKKKKKKSSGRSRARSSHIKAKRTRAKRQRRGNWGGARKRTGRKPGTPNKSTQEIKDLIRGIVDFDKLIKALERKARKGNDRCAKILFEYAFGKPSQQIDVTSGQKPIAAYFVVPPFSSVQPPDASPDYPRRL